MALGIWGDPCVVIDTAGHLYFFHLSWPPEFALDQNYPNPYEGTTYISFKLFQQSPITLCVYDALGNKIATLINNKTCAPGKFVEHFDAHAAGISPGIYYFSLICNSVIMNRKMVYLK